MFETYCKNKGYLLKKMGQKENISVGEENCKSQKKKKKISVGEEKCKRKRKRKRKKIKLNHLLNFWLKKKMLQSCLE